MSDDLIQLAALDALERGGIKMRDPKVLGIFDLSEISIDPNGRAVVPKGFVKSCQEAMPFLFGLTAEDYVDARALPKAEYAKALAAVTRPRVSQQQHASAVELARLQQRYPDANRSR